MSDKIALRHRVKAIDVFAVWWFIVFLDLLLISFSKNFKYFHVRLIPRKFYNPYRIIDIAKCANSFIMKRRVRRLSETVRNP